MPRGADAQPECIHYIFIFLRQRRIVRGSCVRSGFRCGGLSVDEFERSRREHVSLGGDIRLLLLGPRDLCFESPADIFPQGVEKENCNSGL